MGPTTRTDRRVVVVDDDLWRRRGIVDGIRELGGVLTPYAALDYDGGLGFEGWPDVDVVVVASGSGRDRWDRFEGLEIVVAVRRMAPPGSITVVLLVTAPENDLVVLRASEAGVDFVYPLASVRDLEQLEQMLLTPDLARTPGRSVDHPTLRRVGLSYSSRLNATLSYIEQQDLVSAFDDGGMQKLSRRRSITARSRLADIMRARPVGSASGTTVEASMPSWRQLRQIVDVARGASDRLS